MKAIRIRPTVPFTVFHRSDRSEGGYSCHACGIYRTGTFVRRTDVFAFALQHLRDCSSLSRYRSTEGKAILDGKAHAVVLREGYLIVAIDTVVETPGRVARRVTS